MPSAPVATLPSDQARVYMHCSDGREHSMIWRYPARIQLDGTQFIPGVKGKSGNCGG